MVFKELKKILSNKWIIFFLVALCIFNIFFQISYWQEKEDELYADSESMEERIESYSEYIAGIQENVSAISTFKLFNEDGNYNVKSAEKVVEAYDRVKNVQPVAGNYTAVSIFTKSGFSDVIILVMVLQCVALLIDYDRKKGMLTLTKSCMKGRTHLIFSKMGALFIVDALFVTVVNITLFAGVSWHYGCDTLNVPLQSVPDFYESSLPVTVFQYLIIFILLKCLAVLFYSMILLCGIILFKNLGIYYSIAGILALISLLVKSFIQWDYKLALLKVMSPATLTDTASFTYKYYNINVFGTPVSLLGLSVFIMSLGIAFFVIISTVLFSNNWSISLSYNKFKRTKNRRCRVKGMHLMEYKKILITNRGIIIILILVLLQVFIITNVDTEMSDYEKYYSEYMTELEGEQTEETNLYIKNEKKRFSQIEEKHEENIQLYMNGEIDEIAIDSIEQQYEWDMMPQEAFKAVRKHKKYLNKLWKEKGIKGWFVDDIGINYLINPEDIYSEKVVWIFMFTAILLLVTSCFSYEEETGMKCLSDTMPYGRKKLNGVKCKVSLGITTVVYCISNLPFLVLVVTNYNFSGVMAPAYSLEAFQNCTLSIPLLGVLIILYLMKYLVAVTGMFITILVAKKCRGHIKKITVSFIVLVMPLILMIL